MSWLFHFVKNCFLFYIWVIIILNIIINADDYYGKEAFEQAADYLNTTNQNKSYGLVTYKLGKTLSDFGTVSRGICHVDNNKLISIKNIIYFLFIVNNYVTYTQRNK